ncbi:DUF5675 family protein [Odoribacter splanchnicus]|uniref:DUF5675 family protein n=1 Tax=Odoribacter splanchnicus TaxID=28118 RepID=UPI00189A38D9|nr:DUF5675 family protein [Odoribacter splanchnicus]MDB9209675.1 DUF5675 family protein [Odoribacter splanchnicus]MDB9225389.1 DUF5675 family protein [Odoribacter splanchnicus]MDB9237838.1 DUF5675 family protein [Odoribacter splanchnicus]MDB9241796.1 DUF5675 family protein [Odoribacter splanchnicus]HJG19173.1 DUF5675 family protein [Odoribacter splanchnicus]
MQNNLNTLILIREHCFTDRTLGTLIFGSRLFVLTLEPPYFPPEHTRHNSKKTAIPFGTYRLKFSFSPRFNSMKLYVSDVPRRSGIIIHPGNLPADTAGCILPGLDLRNGALTDSRAAVARIEQTAREIIRTQREIFLYITK